jgi:hypothetical protein
VNLFGNKIEMVTDPEQPQTQVFYQRISLPKF